MKPYAINFYNGRQWQQCRDSFIQKRIMIDGGMCQRCHERLGYIVHHRTELTPLNITDPAVALNHDNLEYVCHECHNMIHSNFVNTARIIFDENGDAIPKK